MAFYVQFLSEGLPLSSGKSMIHGMAYGLNAMTPRNLDQGLFQMAGEFAATIGQSAGRIGFNPFRITKEKDFSSPALFGALQGQKSISSLEISIIQANSSGSGVKEQVIGRIALTDAAITNYKWKPNPPKPGRSKSRADTNELEEFDLTFSSITYTNVSSSTSSTDDWTDVH
jgi:type VI secretion system Hcp family effector